MNFLKKIMNFLTEMKNRQIRLAREKIRAFEETNKILSAYVALLVEQQGTVRIPKKMISEALGSYKASATESGEDYIIKIEKIVPEMPILPDFSEDNSENEMNSSDILGE